MDAQPEDTYQIIIAGAGPVGLSLALGLARENVRLLLLEQEADIEPHSKAPAIWSKTLEVLDGLGVAQKFIDSGETLSQITLWDADNGQSLFTLDLTEMAAETAYPSLLILPQPETEKILLAELKKYPNVDIQFSSRLYKFRQWKDEVSVVYVHNGKYRETQGRYLVGCDGAHSRVRELLGFELKGETFNTKAVLADIKLPLNLDYAYPRLSQKEQLSVAIKIRPDLWRMILPFASQEESAINKRIQQGVRNLFGSEQFELIWHSEFKLHDRISNGFHEGRVVLAGDAAHLNSPVGGQGMNAGIQETVLLKAALLKMLKDEGSLALAEYAQTLQAAVKSGVNHFTSLLTRIIFLGRGRFTKRIMRLGLAAMRVRRLRHRFMTRLTMQDQQLH